MGEVSPAARGRCGARAGRPASRAVQRQTSCVTATSLPKATSSSISRACSRTPGGRSTAPNSGASPVSAPSASSSRTTSAATVRAWRCRWLRPGPDAPSGRPANGASASWPRPTGSWCAWSQKPGASTRPERPCIAPIRHGTLTKKQHF